MKILYHLPIDWDGVPVIAIFDVLDSDFDGAKTSTIEVNFFFVLADFEEAWEDSADCFPIAFADNWAGAVIGLVRLSKYSLLNILWPSFPGTFRFLLFCYKVVIF